MASWTNDEIDSIANSINEISESYQLLHATNACKLVIEKRAKEDLGAQIKELQTKLINAERENRKIHNKIISKKVDTEELIKQQSKLDEDRKKYKCNIYVEYIDASEDSARAVKVKNNYFEIMLPELLVDKIKNDDGSYNYEVISKIRKIMAHELGHIVLHTPFFSKSSEGSQKFNNEFEREADRFADKLIELRRMRNSILYKDKGYMQI